eukprot:UN15039
MMLYGRSSSGHFFYECSQLRASILSAQRWNMDAESVICVCLLHQWGLHGLI